MLRTKTMALAGGVSAACLMLGAPSANATAYTIKIGVAANFNATVLDIITKYKAYKFGDGNTYSFTTTSDATGNLRAAILASGTATNAPYDLFLSADTVSPSTVATAGLGLVLGTVTQTPFFYATGSLVLAAQSVNIADCPTPAAGNSCGLPTTGSAVYTDFVIADPSKAPYGAAARTVLNQAPWSLGLNTTTTYPVSHVNTQPNIGLTFYAVNNVTPPTYAYGFVAKSQVCKNGALGSASGGVFKITKAFEYVYNGASSPNFGHTGTTPQTYSKIVQNGIAIERQQSAGLKAVIVDFANYIVGGGDGQGTTLRTKYCYGTTP